METTATSSPPRVPARQRKIRSLRQWPIFETITRTRGSSVSTNRNSMPNSAATAPKSSVNRATSVLSSLQMNLVRRKKAWLRVSSNC
ncbi:hypothetical protein EB73_35105 [Mycobacterium sp. SWH-M3]|nr:hypothetical protein EB73_35105 [Mycobacterium sp. SWH-M3]